jgi:hypothetical protein
VPIERYNRTTKNIPRGALVIVHPTWPWTEPNEKQFRERCRRTTNRILAVVGNYPSSALFLVPTFRPGTGEAAREAALFGVQAGHRASLAMTEEELAQVSLWLAHKLRSYTRVTIAGFYRELCCCEIAHGLCAAGLVVTRPLALTRYSPRQR